MTSPRFLAALISSVLLAAPLLVFAQTQTRPPAFPSPENIRRIASTTKPFIEEHRGMASTSVEARMEMRIKLEDKRQEVEQKIEAAKQKAQAKFSQAVQTSVGNITDMLTRHVGDLTKIADRIDARITELQGKGADMTQSLMLLAQARTDITTAQTAVAAVGTTLSAALSAATPKTEVPKVRAAVKAAEDAIHTAKDSLQKTLQSVRVEGGASASANIHATTTTQVTQ